MKFVIALILTLSTASAQWEIGSPAFSVPAAAAGGSCTVAAGNLYNESFGTPTTLSWVMTGTVDTNATLISSPCSGLGSVGCEVNWDGSATRPYITWTRGSLLNATLYFRYYFRVVSHSFADLDWVYLFYASETETASQCFFSVVKRIGSQLSFRCFAGGTDPAYKDITTGVWYRAEVKYVPAGTSEYRLFTASDGAEIGSAVTFTANNNWIGYMRVGVTTAENTVAQRFQLDGLGISDVGYLGQ